MRSLDDAKESWAELQKYTSLQDLKEAVRLDGGSSSIATSGCRSACWKAFLIFESVDTSTWTRTLSSARSAYNALRSHFLRHLENPDEIAAVRDPLSEDDESTPSPWQQLRKDEELRAEIMQDVDRCMPENLYFRQPETQRVLLDILFIFCKLNPDVSYRQGMHELLAPVLWVVERDAIDLGQGSRVLGDDAIIKTIFEAEHIEHDTFTLFGQLMQSAKTFYEQTTTSGVENPIVVRSRRIFTEMLPIVDERLAQHLVDIDIVPQVFLMRWIRLLFGREFAFDDMLTVWDVIFAEDPILELVDHISVAMLLRLHWQLIEADYNEALSLLLRYPGMESGLPPQTFALDALYLREHMNRHGGSYIVSEHTGRPLEQAGRPVTPPALQRNITTFSGPNAIRPTSPSTQSIPSRTPRQSRNIETVLASTAKNLYSRGEKLGIGKAVRSAVDEVHKKAQEIRDAQMVSTPSSWRQRSPRGSAGTQSVTARIQELEQRSRQLAKLLEGAVGELWEYQRLVAEGDREGESAGKPEEVSVESLSVAIAKVQFVQVYLDDPALPLPEPDVEKADAVGETPVASATHHGSTEQDPSNNEPSREVKGSEQRKRPAQSQPGLPQSTSKDLADPASFEDFSQPSAAPEHQSQEVPAVVVQPSSDTPTTPALDPAPQPSPPWSTTAQSRPRLEQSSLSWMLGQASSSNSPFGNASSFPPEHGRGRGALFAAAEDEPAPKEKERRGSGKASHKKTGSFGIWEDEGFDLGSLRRGKGGKS